jgi:hypothetical protein
VATAEADICNLALLRIGQRQTIDDLDEESEQAEACSVLYPLARDAVLEAARWPFATGRAELAALSGVTRTNWQYVYALPTDYLAARFIVVAGLRAPAVDQRIPYALEYDSITKKQVLLTDLSPAELVYTARIENVALFSPLFVQALAWKLAADLCLALPVKPGVGVAMQQQYRIALSEAAASMLNQQQGDPPPDSEFVRERS